MMQDPLWTAIRALQAFADKTSWYGGVYDGPHTEFVGLDQDNLAAKAISMMKASMWEDEAEAYFGGGN